MSPRSGLLAAWTNAFRAGRASLDQVVDATTGTDARHQVVGLIAEPDRPASLYELIVAWRHADEPVRLALPVPGDVRGLAGPAPFRILALGAGEAALCGALGASPEVTGFSPSSAPAQVVWHAVALEPAAVDYEAVGDAQLALSTAIRETAAALTAADVSGGDVPVALAEALSAARRSSEHLDLPPGHPQRAVALLAQAERMQAVLELARTDAAGGAVDRLGMSARDAALRPLGTAVRRALMAGYSAC